MSAIGIEDWTFVKAGLYRLLHLVTANIETLTIFTHLLPSRASTELVFRRMCTYLHKSVEVSYYNIHHILLQ